MKSEPLGTFTYEPLRDAHVVIGLAGGSGITPFRSLAKAIVDGTAPAAALAGLNDERFSIASDCASKLYVAYAPYTGE
mgnify:CR=1 FL=1